MTSDFQTKLDIAGRRSSTFEEFLVDCFSVRLWNEHSDTRAIGR